MRLVWLLAPCLLVGGFAADAQAPAPADPNQVDVELELAVDISGSVTPEEGQLQRQGYISGLTNPRVLQAINSGEHGRIAITYFEWANARDQRLLVPWTVIDGPASAQGVADILKAMPISRNYGTSISGAIDYGKALFASNPYKGPRRVIDISGDGRNNNGRPSTDARDEAVAEGIVINGLPIINTRPFYGRAELDVDQSYKNEVIGGDRSFLIVVKDFDSFSNALLTKLIQEIAMGEARMRVAKAR